MNSTAKGFCLVLLFALILILTSICIPTVYSSESINADQALSFLSDVAGIDTSRYNAELVSSGIVYPKNLYGIAKETTYHILNGPDQSKLSVVCQFVNGSLSYCTINTIAGKPLYVQEPPRDFLKVAESFFDRYQSYKETSYIQEMSHLLSKIENLGNMTIKENNLKLVVSNGDYLSFKWMYTQNDIDFQIKSVGFILRDGNLYGFWDNWSLYNIGGTDAISKGEAISVAMDYVKTYSLNISTGSNNFTVISPSILSEPVDAWLITGPRETLALYPAWTVQLYFEKPYYTYYGIQLRLWGDTKQIIYCHPTGAGGDSSLRDSSDNEFSEPVIPQQSNSDELNSSSYSLQLETVYAIIVAVAIIIVFTGFMVAKCRTKPNRK